MTWAEFAEQDPELAALGEERLDKNGLVMLATLRKNGWPRISPVEPLFFNGQLYLGMMWRSQKALDLLRDPRCSIHNAVSDRHATEGEFKVYGRATDVADIGERERYLEAMSKKIDIPMGQQDFHCFAIDLHSAAANTLIGEEFQHQTWQAG
ncbi:MAG: pyridoxamine 5'-phosphate oxidase family protein [Chloroflexi bacterium]|nr:pyridoxamine 5'-phosphate oxidase family protein [Chloroflexota bacterium]